MGKLLRKIWCERFGHPVIRFGDGGLLVRHKCLLCSYYNQTYMGGKPKLKFMGFGVSKDWKSAIKEIKIK